MEETVPPGTGVAERIRSRREASGLTNDQLATALDVSRKTVERWQTTGGGSIKTDRIFALADVLNVDPAWLLRGDATAVTA